MALATPDGDGDPNAAICESGVESVNGDEDGWLLCLIVVAHGRERVDET